MRSKLLHEAHGKRTFALILQKGDEAMRCLEEFAAKERLGGAQITAIGALSGATLAFFDWETKKYQPIQVSEQVEVASLIGDIATGPDGKPSVHAHCGAWAAGWNHARGASSGRPCQADPRNHRDRTTGPFVQGEGRGERSCIDQDLTPHDALR